MSPHDPPCRLQRFSPMPVAPILSRVEGRHVAPCRLHRFSSMTLAPILLGPRAEVASARTPNKCVSLGLLVRSASRHERHSRLSEEQSMLSYGASRQRPLPFGLRLSMASPAAPHCQPKWPQQPPPGALVVRQWWLQSGRRRRPRPTSPSRPARRRTPPTRSAPARSATLVVTRISLLTSTSPKCEPSLLVIRVPNPSLEQSKGSRTSQVFPLAICLAIATPIRSKHLRATPFATLVSVRTPKRLQSKSLCKPSAEEQPRPDTRHLGTIGS